MRSSAANMARCTQPFTTLTRSSDSRRHPRARRSSLAWAPPLVAWYFWAFMATHCALAQPEASSVVTTPQPDLLPIEVEDRLVSGLILELSNAGSEQHSSGLTDARPARLVSMHLSHRDAASPFLAPGPFHAVWRGHLYSEVGEVVQFSFAGDGAAQLEINGQLILDGPAGEAGGQSPAVQLHPGFNAVRVAYRTPEDGAARFRLLWAGEEFIPEPVLATVLFHDPDDPLLVERTRLRESRELVATHSCLKCHAAAVDLQEARMPELSKDNPNLKEVGQRVQPNWLVQWILAPSSMRNHATMPAVALGNSSSARKQTAADIAAFLTSAVGPTGDDGAADEQLDQLVDEGEILFEEYSCLACHRFTEPSEPDDFDRISLHYTGAKYRPGELANYLQSPHKNYAWSRMPDMRLGRGDAEALAAFIRTLAEGQCNAPAELASADPQRGGQAYRRVGCAHCHPLDQDRASLATMPKLGKRLSATGCLAKADQRSAGAPVIAVTESQREALLAFDEKVWESLQLSVPSEVSRRYVSSLRCNACHDRDGEPNLLGDVLFDESVTGRPPEIVPHLTWVGEKLKRSWMEDLFAGRLETRARPWMKLQMPQFPVRAVHLAAGLAAEHGVPPVEQALPAHDPRRAEIGQRLTLQAPQGFFCVQCHGVGDKKAVGAFDHKGINFALVSERIRRDFYTRWITDPMRIDPGSKMPKLAPDGKTTNINTVYDGDAQLQFDAIWHYLQSLGQ